MIIGRLHGRSLVQSSLARLPVDMQMYVVQSIFYFDQYQLKQVIAIVLYAFAFLLEDYLNI